jgi:large subunit ribosomal protein L25
MEKFVITATKRTLTGKKVGTLRREAKLPGVIYGHKFETVAITMDHKEATKVLNKATSSSVININLEGKDVAVLIREKQKNYLKNIFTHVDFQAVSLTEKIRAAVNVELAGISPAVKDFSGIVVEGLTSIEVEALPNDLPERFIIDIATLTQIGNQILVKDVVVSQGVEILTPADEVVVLIAAPAIEETEGIAGEEAGLEPEVIEKGKKEETEE